VTRQNLLGPHEQLILLAILRIGEEAYGMTIRREVEQRSHRDISIGAVYTNRGTRREGQASLPHYCQG